MPPRVGEEADLAWERMPQDTNRRKCVRGIGMFVLIACVIHGILVTVPCGRSKPS